MRRTLTKGPSWLKGYDVMTDPQANIALVLKFFELMNSRDPALMAQAVALMAEDAIYWIPGDWANGGTFSKSEVAAMVARGTDVFQDRLEITIHGITASDDRVAVEMESKGRFKDGRPYNNTYHWLFVIRDGTLRTIKEYTDTLYANGAYYGG